jgi:hypothetical protein
VSHPVSEDAYAWGREELARRDAEVARCRDFDAYEAMKRRWDYRQRQAGLSDAVRKQVIRAAVDERKDARVLPWVRAS